MSKISKVINYNFPTFVNKTVLSNKQTQKSNLIISPTKMPFEERIETNRASINYLISSENLLQQQIESLNWEVGKLKSVSSELRSVLSEIGTFKPKSNISHLWSSLEKMEAEFQR